MSQMSSNRLLFCVNDQDDARPLSSAHALSASDGSTFQYRRPLKGSFRMDTQHMPMMQQSLSGVVQHLQQPTEGTASTLEAEPISGESPHLV